CVAPTYGEVIWGSGYQVMEWWGTSGACPQVAGLAALLLSADPALKPAQVGDIIRKTCRGIQLPKTCAGAGLIDCEAALGQVKKRKKRKKRTGGQAEGVAAPRRRRDGAAVARPAPGLAGALSMRRRGHGSP